MALAGREVILLTIQIKDSLPFPSQQLMNGVKRYIPKHEDRLLVNLSVAVL